MRPFTNALWPRCAAALILLVLAGCTALPPIAPEPPAELAPAAAPTATPVPASAAPAPVQPASPLAGSGPTAAPTPPASPAGNPAWDDRTIFRRGLISSEQGILDRLSDASVYHISLVIGDDLTTVKGQQQVRYTHRQRATDQPLAPLEEIYFRLFPNATGGAMTVSAVQVDGQKAQPALEFNDTALRAPLATPLPMGKSVVIGMEFEVRVPRELNRGYGLLSFSEGVLSLDSVYPAIPVYDDEGWNVEQPVEYADLSYFDASLYVVRVSAPAQLTLVASGSEVSRERTGDRQTVTFAAGPARDFYLAASARYTVVSATVGETVINSYALADRVESAKVALAAGVNAVKSFNARIGLYPYTEMDIASTPLLALGIEYPGIMGLALRMYDPSQTVSGLPSRAALESVTAHEVAHQWFYNAIGNDQLDEPWLDEALAQYATGLYYLDTQGERGAQAYRESWGQRWDRVNRVAMPIGLPAASYKPQEYSAIVYGRGPLFVSALASRMGQQTFDRFLRDYYVAYRWGIATTAGFKALAEQHCRCDLTPLFAEWVN
jgi:hypothetical protein